MPAPLIVEGPTAVSAMSKLIPAVVALAMAASALGAITILAYFRPAGILVTTIPGTGLIPMVTTLVVATRCRVMG